MSRKGHGTEPIPSLGPRLYGHLTEGDRSRSRRPLDGTATGIGNHVDTVPARMKTRGQMLTRKGAPLGGCESCTR